MASYQGRRRADQGRSRTLVVGTALAAVVTATVVAVRLAGAGEAQPTRGPDTTTAGGCGEAVRVAVPPAYGPTWTALAAAHVVEDCAPVRVEATADDEVAAGAVPGIGGWIPADATALAGDPVTEVGEPPLVAGAPVVLAMDAEDVERLGGADRLARAATLGPLVRGERRMPDGAELSVALPDPTTSTAGALGFVGLAGTAAGRPVTAPPSYLSPSRADLTLIRTEHRVVATGPDERAVLESDADAVVTTAPLLAGTGRTGVALRTAPLRMPLVTLDEEAAPVLAGFAEFLGSDAGAAALTEAGLVPPSALPPGVAATAEQVQQAGQLFGFMHTRISTMVAVDASGSMLETMPGGTTSKVDLVRRAARDAMEVAAPTSRSGLLTFRSDEDDVPVLTRTVDLATNGTQTGSPQRAAMLAALEDLEVSGGTPLYNAVRDAYRYAVAEHDGATTNQVVLLSDGENRDAVGSITLDALLRDLRAAADPDRPVRIIAIGIGDGADLPTLRRIAEATGGRASWMRTIDDYAGAVEEALFTP